MAATLTNVNDGVHTITIKNAPSVEKGRGTNSTDHLYIRVGAPGNPIVFPTAANYSKTLVTKEGNDLFVNHAAAGATQWRYSTNWGSSYSDWKPYTGGKEDWTTCRGLEPPSRPGAATTSSSSIFRGPWVVVFKQEGDSSATSGASPTSSLTVPSTNSVSTVASATRWPCGATASGSCTSWMSGRPSSS